MTLKPARYTLEIPQRGTLRLRMRLPVTNTGQRFIAAVYDERRDTKLLAIQVLFPTDPAPVTGTTLIELYAPRSATRGMTQDGVWDLLVLDDDLPALPADATEDDGTYYLRGPAVLVTGISDTEDEVPPP
jgi:hypothetical protein